LLRRKVKEMKAGIKLVSKKTNEIFEKLRGGKRSRVEVDR